MKDKDMKRLLNQCADNSKTESDISAEEIKQAVMAKINGNAPEAEIENGEFVQPTFVNTRPKRKYALTAAAAVVCVGVGAAGIAVANGGIGDGDFSAFTETTENTSETAEEYVWEEENAVMIPLLDGQVWYYDPVNDSVKGEYHHENNKIQFEVSQDDQLWFTVDGERINITEAAGEKDYYVYTYINSGTGKEHQMVIANTTDPFYCGYMEIYPLGEYYGGDGCNVHIATDIVDIKDTYNTSADDMVRGEHYWFKAALDDMGFVRDESEEGEKIFSSWSYSVTNILPCDSYTFNLADGTQIKWIDGENRFDLDDGTKIIQQNDGERCWQENKVGTETDNVIKVENGKIYYTAYREKTDITGKTDSDTPYVRRYLNPLFDTPVFALAETRKHIEPIHYIIVGGTEEGGDLGYAELLSCEGKWYGSTYNAVVGGELRPWLKAVLDVLFDDLNADNFLEKCTMSSDRAVIEQFAQMVNMLDGSWENGSQQSMPQWDIFEIEDGKLWFTGNGERIDVAEAAGDKDYFIYRYTPEGSIDERIVIGANTADIDEVGYLEIYSVYDMEHGEYTHYRGLGDNVYLWKENIEDGVEDIKPWVKNAFEELGLRLADNNVIAVNEVVIGRG